MNSKTVIFTDGASRGNPGRGGWGAIVCENFGADVCRVGELGGAEDNTTNNRMELSAAIGALAYVEKNNTQGDLEIYTDSSYLLKGVTLWMRGWERNDWRTKTGEPVLNQDLWKNLGGLVSRLKRERNIDWKKIEGHAGLLGNERADKIATDFADNSRAELFSGLYSDYLKILGGDIFQKDISASLSVKNKKASAGKKAYSYVSMIAGVVAADKTWAECEARVKGKNAKFKKVFSHDEEEALIKEWKEEFARASA